MRKYYIITISLLFITGLRAQETSIESSKQIIKPLLETYPGIQVSVAKNNKIVWSESFGYADSENNIKLNNDHRLALYSLSKPVTGMVIARLIENGKIDVEARITKYLDDLPQVFHDVKIRQLLHHTAGIRHYEEGEWRKLSKIHCDNLSSALSTFIEDDFINSPGDKYSYSSFGYVLLSRVAEVVTGASFESLVLELNDVVGGIEISPKSDSQVRYYSKWKQSKNKGKEAPQVDNSCKGGAGYLVSSAEDFTKLFASFMNQQIVPAEVTNKYFSKGETNKGESFNYGYGIGITQNKNGELYYSHSGSGMGSNAVVIALPADNIVVTLLGNLEDKSMNGVAYKIAQIFK